MDLVHVEELLPANATDWQPGDAFLAGGTWLFSEPQPSVRRLLDLSAFGWPALTPLPDGGLEIAATCTLAELAAVPALPLFRQCCDALLGSFKVWHEATVGGNLCLGLPAGPMIALAAALDGTCEIWGAGTARRDVGAAGFVLGPRRTVLEPGELLRSVRLPGHALAARHAFRQYSLSAVGRSAALVIGRLDADGSAAVTVTAATPRPYVIRFPRLPRADEAVTAVRTAVGDDWHDDVHGDPRWRAAITADLVTQVVHDLAHGPSLGVGRVPNPAIDAPATPKDEP